MQNKLKLIIWDLDDTFWDGNLCEGTFQFKERNIRILKESSRRGIQLNYTKIRADQKELKQLIVSHDVECAVISVNDKYGDNGASGFYALDKHDNIFRRKCIIMLPCA